MVEAALSELADIGKTITIFGVVIAYICIWKYCFCFTWSDSMIVVWLVRLWYFVHAAALVTFFVWCWIY